MNLFLPDPSTVTVDGDPIDTSDAAHVRSDTLPGFLGWVRHVYRQPGDKTTMLVWTREANSFSGIDPADLVCAALINNQPELPVLVAEGKGATSFITPLSPGCGKMWWSKDWLLEQVTHSDDVLPPKVLAWFASTNAKQTWDIEKPHSAGSGSKTWHHPATLWIERYGKTWQGVLWAAGTIAYQFRRPQWLLDPATGASRALLGEIPLQGYKGSWYYSAEGIAGDDAQHADIADELEILRVFGWPMGLESAINTVAVLSSSDPYWGMKKPNSYAGSARAPGWLFDALAHLLTRLPTDPAYASIAKALTVYGKWHVENWREQHPLWSPYFSGAPTEIVNAQVPFRYVWQDHGVLAFGLGRLARIGGDPHGLRHIAVSIAHETKDRYFRINGANGRPEFVNAFNQDGSVMLWGQFQPGTASWHLATATLLAEFSPAIVGLRDLLVADRQALGKWGPDDHDAVAHAAPLLGFPDVL